MPRLLFYVLLVTLVFVWGRRFLRFREMIRRAAGTQRGGTMPKSIVCASCGTTYDPQVSGWTCPTCKK